MRRAPIALLFTLLAILPAASMTLEELDAITERADESMAKMALIREQSRQEVRDFAYAACERLWRKDKDAAILNPVCFEVFTQLPD